MYTVYDGVCRISTLGRVSVLTKSAHFPQAAPKGLFSAPMTQMFCQKTLSSNTWYGQHFGGHVVRSQSGMGLVKVIPRLLFECRQVYRWRVQAKYVR